MYCTNCGAKQGETDQEKNERQGDPSSWLDVIYLISTSERGSLCQFCQSAPYIEHWFNSETGECLAAEEDR